MRLNLLSFLCTLSFFFPFRFLYFPFLPIPYLSVSFYNHLFIFYFSPPSVLIFFQFSSVFRFFLFLIFCFLFPSFSTFPLHLSKYFSSFLQFSVSSYSLYLCSRFPLPLHSLIFPSLCPFLFTSMYFEGQIKNTCPNILPVFSSFPSLYSLFLCFLFPSSLHFLPFHSLCPLLFPSLCYE